MHGVNSAFGVSDLVVAGILGNGVWPDGDVQAWDDDSKNQFMAEYMGYMTRAAAHEVVAESAFDMPANEARLVFIDPIEYCRALSGHMYLHMESDVSDQIDRARKLLQGMAA